MQQNYQRLRPKLLSHDYDAATAYLEAQKGSVYSKHNRLLYYMDAGMVLHLAGRFSASNAALEQAKEAAEALWTESIGANAAAWLTTDNSLPYQGEDFEKVLIHFIAALNYIGMGSYGDARVEARQITQKLELYNSKYETKNVYRDDGFTRWLAGRLAEMEGSQEALNDAWIDYQRALTVYEKDYATRYEVATPAVVINSALRALQALGPEFADESAKLLERYPGARLPVDANAANLGRVVFLHLNGEAPFKVDRYWVVPAGVDTLRVAYPEFVPKAHVIEYADVTVRQTGIRVRSEKLEDITAIAMTNLRDHIGRIQAKAIARALAKYLAGTASQVAGAEVGGGAGEAMAVAGSLWHLGNYLVEEADKRSWITLPSTVNGVDVAVPPGPVTLDVSFTTATGQVVERQSFQTSVQPGQTVFVSYRTYQ